MRRMIRLIAVVAVLSHAWVSLIGAPWHYLVAHHLPSIRPTNQLQSASPAKRCHCCHHAHCSKTASAADGTRNPSESPLAPVGHDDCPVCQTLAQAYAYTEVPVPELSFEFLEFSRPISAIPLLLGDTIDRVSRGPPIA